MLGILVGALALGPLACAKPLDGQAVADTAFLMREVRALAADSMEGRRVGTLGGAKARRYLVRRLEELQLKPFGKSHEHAFDPGVNLLAVIPGTRHPQRYLVLSAHYDGLGVVRGTVLNGADDNASGVAAVLALARELSARPLAHSVIVALLDGEEAGLLGAEALLAAPPVPKEALVLNLNLDMVGHSDAGELWAAGAAKYPALLPALQAAAKVAPVKLRLGHDRRGVAGERDWTPESDHGAFHAAGIPFVYFGVEDHQDYHRASDDPETLTPVFFGAAVQTILIALRKLDGLTTFSPAGTSP